MNVRKIDINEFRKRKLERSYISVYVVIKPMMVETEEGIEPKNLCLFYGFTALGARKVIAIYFEDTKDNRFWLNIFEDLKSRNLKNIMFLVTPKNKNIERCAKIIYNDIEVIRSPEDIMNSIDVFFATKTSRELEIQLKNLLLTENETICKEKIELFKQQYIHNKLILSVFEKQEQDILNLYKYNYDIRKLLYQYYAIRDIKRQINKLNELQPLCSDIYQVAEHFLEYICSFERGLSYSKKGWVRLMNILYETYPKKMEEYF
jgi:transposase-like protein